MFIERVKYKMEQYGEEKTGYTIGAYEGDTKVLLDENFNYVPRIVDEDAFSEKDGEIKMYKEALPKCTYCRDGKKFSWGTWTEVRIEDNKLVVYAPEDDEIHIDKFDIEFCPKCGHKLIKR